MKKKAYDKLTSLAATPEMEEAFKRGMVKALRELGKFSERVEEREEPPTEGKS